MSKAAELIESIRLSGGNLELRDARLIYTAAAGVSADSKAAIMTQLRACKAGLIALLQRPKESSEAEFDSYEVDPGVFLHSPRTSAEFLAWRERMAGYGRKK